MELEVRHLRLLLVLAETGSISATAQRLGVPQPALSRQLRRIEARLGHEVFTRSRAGVSLTLAGARFLADAGRVLAAFDALVPAETGAPATPDTLRVATHCLPVDSLIHGIRAELGITAVHGRESTAQHAVDAVADGLVDLAGVTVWPHSPDLRVPDTVRRVVAVTEPMAVMLHHQHPLACRSTIDLADLRDESWVARAGLDTTSVECAKAGFTADITHYHDDHGYYIDLVGSGMCVAFCSPTSHTTPAIAIRPYADAAAITWNVFHDPSRLPRATVDHVARADRRAAVLARRPPHPSAGGG